MTAFLAIAAIAMATANILGIAGLWAHVADLNARIENHEHQERTP